MPRTKFVEFKCPECEGSTLEEVSQGVMYNQINGFYRGYAEYDGNDFEDTEVMRYQCYDCGENLLEGYQLDLFEECKNRGWLVIEEIITPDPDWEV